jgi:hypothetical protein
VNLGNQIVTFLTTAQTGTRGPMGTKAMSEAGTPVKGCLHRPYRASGSGSGTARAQYPEVGVGVATQWWQTTTPPHPAAIAAKAADFIQVDGVTYKVIEDAKPFPDFSGKVFKVSILSERQTIT